MDVGVFVAVSVMVGVIVGVFDTVGVGPVAVGNGPISAPAVSARAVFVAFAFWRVLFKSSALAGPKIAENNNNKARNRPDAIKICKTIRFSLALGFKFNLSNLLSCTF